MDVNDHLTLSFDLHSFFSFFLNLTVAITFEPLEIELSYFTCIIIIILFIQVKKACTEYKINMI